MRGAITLLTALALPFFLRGVLLFSESASPSPPPRRRRSNSGGAPVYSYLADDLARVVAEYPFGVNSDRRRARPLNKVLAEYKELVDRFDPRDPTCESSLFLARDLLTSTYRITESGVDRGRRIKTVGSSVDPETYEVFNSIVALVDKRPGVILGQLLEKFILLARPHVPFIIDEENGPGAHEKRIASDTKYRQIFEWKPRFVLARDDSEPRIVNR
jgi:hypothetical protein